MPVDWRLEVPLTAFIEDVEHCRMNQATRPKRRVFNDKGQARKRTSRTRRNSKHTISEIEGAFEVQRLLLLKLAGQENQVKGLSGMDTNEREIGSRCEAESRTPPSKANLERFMADTAQAVRAIWTQNGKRTRIA